MAFFALACQFVLSFGHVHLGNLIGNFGIASIVAADGAAGTIPTPAPHKKPIGLADDHCAICNSIKLASTSIVPTAPTLEAPFDFFQGLAWPAPQAAPTRFEYVPFQARGPPKA